MNSLTRIDVAAVASVAGLDTDLDLGASERRFAQSSKERKIGELVRWAGHGNRPMRRGIAGRISDVLSV